jgi:transcriptional regulator
MYIPAAFRESDTDRLHDLMRRYAFATLITVENGSPFASHIPVLFIAAEGTQGVLRTHLAKNNPQAKSLTAGVEVLAIFHGPHAYVSPSWYVSEPNVPTWNYAVVHAYGTPRRMADGELRTFLQELTAAFESKKSQPWQSESLASDYLEKLERGIVGIEITITRLEGKFKMSQNKNEADQRGAIAGLRATGDPESLATAEIMAQILP